MASKKKAPAKNETDELLRLKEMERLRAEKEMEMKAEARLARLNELLANCKASRFDQETKLVSSFNNYLYEKQSAGEARKKEESWDRWMDQNGKPDLLSVQSVSAFISQCTESNADEESVLNQYRLVNDLIIEIKELTLDFPDRKDQLINAVEQLNAMKEKRIDQLTLEYLKNPAGHIDDQSDDLFREFKDEQSGLEYMVWANLSKNTRRKNVTFESTGVKVELTNEQCRDDAGLRVYYTKEDNFDILMPLKLDPESFPDPVEPEEEEEQVEPEEETVPSTTSVEESSAPKDTLKPPGSTKPSRAGSQLSALDAAEVEPEEEEDTEETIKPERFGLDGKNGVGGVWHINFLTVPDGPKKMNNWTIQRYYENELKTCPLMAEDGIEVVLPIPEQGANKKSLEVGIWNRQTRKWETENININEQKDGSIYFNTKQTGAFRFFIDRHENEDKPLVETWLIRPNNDVVEFHVILQNYQLVFEVLPNGNVNLIEKHEPKVLKLEQRDVDVESLLLKMEEDSLFVFPTDDSIQYLDYIVKEEFVTCRTYQNMCSIAHLNEFKMSPYNPTLPNERLALTANQNTVLCGENSFYIVEDNYIPPEPPVKPNYATPEDEKADEAFKKELQLYEEKIEEEENKFEPDFEISREGETMQATLDAVLGCEGRINEQNLAIYKLLLKSRIFNF